MKGWEPNGCTDASVFYLTIRCYSVFLLGKIDSGNVLFQERHLLEITTFLDA
jgi:hypothetical protein